MLIDTGNASFEEVVNEPSHYQFGEIETIDFVKSNLSAEEFQGYILGNILKYAARAGKKDGEPASKDIAKIRWYAHFLLTGEKWGR